MTQVALVASGDLRESANVMCWPAQKAMEDKLTEVFALHGAELVRGHPVKEDKGHGFIATQAEGLEVFRGIDPDMPIVVAEAVWQYSYHVLPGLLTHRGPILTIGNWSGEWPGLVGLLNLNGSLTKVGVEYSTIWSDTFDDDFFRDKLAEWLEAGVIRSHDASHVKGFNMSDMSEADLAEVERIAGDMKTRKTIFGVFDEGCMGMHNAIVPDELMMPLGIFKERLSQSALYYATREVPDDKARAVYEWLVERGMSFRFGSDPAEELTKAQVIDQCRMYVAAVEMADAFGCEAIGIQYQQGLKDLLPASDLVEGMLNNDDRPDVRRTDGSIIREGDAIVHFNEVDECAGIDGVMTNRLHRAFRQPVETTLHDLRWGGPDESGGVEGYVWVFEISGAIPPAHIDGGWAGAESLRQPAMFFPSGGGSLRGISRPGEIIWSRVFIQGGRLHMDIGRGHAVRLDPAEERRRADGTNPQWPIMNAILHGVTRDQMMARHKSNHIQVAYATSKAEATRMAYAKAALAEQLGMEVALCGDVS